MKQRKIERLLENLLTIDDGLVLLLCVPAQLDLHKWTGDAAAWLRKVPGTNHLQGTNTTALILCTQSGPKCIFVHKWTLNVTHDHDRGTESVCACGGTPWPQFCIWLPSCPDEGRSYPYAWTPAAARSPFVRSDWRGRCSAACIYLGGHKNLNNFTVSLLLQANPDNFLTGRLDSVTCVIFSAGVDRYPPKTWQTT